MSIDLESLGFTKEELQERVINRLCENIEGSEDANGKLFNEKLNELVRKRVDATITAIAEKHVLPNVASYIEALVLQETTKWGQKIGEPITFIEYLTKRAEAYLAEEVDYQGKSRSESGSYSWTKSQTRVAHMIHEHLHYNIHTAMKNALEVANSAIAGGIEKTARIKLEEISKALTVNVKIK